MMELLEYEYGILRVSMFQFHVLTLFHFAIFSHVFCCDTSDVFQVVLETKKITTGLFVRKQSCKKYLEKSKPRNSHITM